MTAVELTSVCAPATSQRLRERERERERERRRKRENAANVFFLLLSPTGLFFFSDSLFFFLNVFVLGM